ncbi:precorrin-3B C(17)-methyltransferase [Paraburkholderia sp. SARCC-3016]|uniref:precorrin-3B C(17)-methyltransferase n=1 Tax=Paraburkholderia sp. SARCC-3016 TaxID=3058611 RepID=UPI00280747DF|nr:precorrin-3B C(17)-methyltransferase [Paraburkholderia sp. SARCC-3016]MDQ7978949.1 precorrin-3B C(17)-methyltransferase [Paraburkholderia sp. SARCC-3016]
MARLMAPAIVILGSGALATARRIQRRYPDARVHGLRSRFDARAERGAGSGFEADHEAGLEASIKASAEGVDIVYDELSSYLRELYASGTPIIALCAAGIVIRCVAPLLANKGTEPPVLAVAEDGSAVVPLLGGLAGVNAMAREIAQALDVPPAITTSGELRFGTCVLNPPPGYALASIEQGKRFVSDLLAGEHTRIEGGAHWLDDAPLPRSETARRAIRVTPLAWDGNADELLIHPRSVVVALADGDGETAVPRVRDALAARRLSPLALAAVIVPSCCSGDEALERAAHALGAALRFADVADAADAAHTRSLPSAWLEAALPAQCEIVDAGPGIALAVAETPLDPDAIGRARGRLTVIGLGPGSADLMVPAARDALRDATDILGYATYVDMAGPFRADQRVHPTDNREEMQRARHAFELASGGRHVVMVSSGDPGVFAMASAVLEALDTSGAPHWADVELQIVPGVSAAMATAARAGAPLGHDFCMLSLSDNLKPWAVIESRVALAAQADLVMAFYNPVSRARPWQLDKALDIVRTSRAPDTIVVLGRDIGRPGASLVSTTLGRLSSADVDMRTMVIIGSSTTRAFSTRPPSARGTPREWVYTPRWYR